MCKDYHMHPMILQKPEQIGMFVKKAIHEGIDEICITDHMPLLCSNAKDRIPHGKVRDYCNAVRSLAKQYEPEISIKLGIEIDYHPDVEDEIEAVLEAGTFDYVLGSSHLHVVKEHELFNNETTCNEYAKLMFENTIAAIESGYFDAIAHLDMFRWVFTKMDRYPLVDDGYSEKLHIALIDETLCAIKEHDLLLEINPHFAGQTGNICDTYPCTYIVQKALQRGIQFSYGSDAHSPECVGEFLNDLREHPIYGEALKIWENK